MKAIERYYQSAPPLAKNAMVVVGVGIAGLTFWEIYKRIRTAQRDRDAGNAPRAASQDIAVLESRGQRATLSASQFDSIITSITEAATGCGTDEDAIYNAFRKLNNSLDFLYLIKLFGVQYYQPCAVSSPISYAKWLADYKSFPGDLPTWLNYDLDQDEIEEINYILRARGITYQL